MLALLSPAKSLDYDRRQDLPSPTEPRLEERTSALVLRAQGMSVNDIKTKMSISQNLAELNFDRWQNFYDQDAQPAIQVFDGDVYTGLDAQTLTKDEVAFAQDHLRILSGLYGMLRPMDLMRPYRLEMGTKRFPADHKLSIWWEDAIAQLVDEDLKGQERSILNLASQEYYASVKGRLPEDIRVVDVEFIAKDGRFITMHAKVARGTMARWMIQNGIDKIDDMRGYDEDGYEFDAAASDTNHWIFKNTER